MKIRKIKQLCRHQIKVTLDDPLLTSIQGEGMAKIDTLIFKKCKNIYSLSEIFIANSESDNFKYFSYELGEFEFVNTTIESINNTLNSKIEIHNIIPLNYLKINNKYYKINNINSILNLRNILNESELKTPFKKIPYSFSKQFEGDDGFVATEFDKVTDIASKFLDSELLLEDFFNCIAVA